MKFKHLLLLVVAGFLAWIWFGNRACELPKLPADATILAFGDSLTQGVGASRGNDYPTILAELTGLNVVNAGISGETTAEGAKRFAAELDKANPDLVLLLEGGNDFLRNLSEQQAEANLATMIVQAQSRDIAVVLIAVPQKSVWLAPADLYARLAEQYQLSWIEATLTELLGSPELKSDSVHLNEQGYRRLAEQIQSHLQQAGAL
ncbi:GDSL-type esterase/lipase family protein [Shewanella sp. Isolate11]|uniref:GDSL-type esterase/lipase family protein n=1 Tax=Shewanella sp. Isolate11 TaxID=2908530 RepID=UPI001EFCB224|nr:GDSL-type esterase/lipase family protein [Shewanella sp. Isolate11]MCG9697720.1 GDSL-type esterase/lipase family protein [Shewanella sp. Isolate11]